MLYFYKELLGNPIYCKGKAVQFDPVTADCGVLATEDEELAKELRVFIAERRGGVREETQEQYEARVKKKDLRPLGLQSQPGLRLLNHLENPMFKAPVPPSAPPVAEADAKAVVAHAAGTVVPPATAPVASVTPPKPVAPVEPAAPPITLKTKRVPKAKVVQGA